MIERRAASGSGDLKARRFLELALGLRFETRFASETKWWPAPILDVAETLLPYHRDAEACLLRMLNGEEVCSHLAVYRIQAGADRTRGESLNRTTLPQ